MMIGNRTTSLILTVGFASCLALIPGCRSENELMSTERQARLLSAQNVDLKQRVLDVEAENEKLRHYCAAKLKQKDEELAKYKAQNELLQKDLDEGIAQRVTGVTMAVMEENARLRTKIDALQAETARLKAEMQ